MISVIIFTKNNKYAVLDVPENGRLIIREKHLLAGITQNGVKMLPYGQVLTPFETFIWDNTLDATLLPSGIWSEEGRVLDFASIELLQAQTTIHPSNSGSTEQFQKPIYTAGGHPIAYNLMLRNANLTLSSANSMFEDICFTVNSISDIGDGYQKFSLVDPSSTIYRNFQNNKDITEIYDLTGFIKTTTSYSLDGLSSLEIVDLPGLTEFGNHTIYTGAPNKLKLMKLHSLPYFGGNPDTADALQIGGGFNKIPSGVQFEVPRSMETVTSSGGLDADLQNLIDLNKAPNIVFID